MGDTTWTYTTEGNTITDSTTAGTMWGVVDSGTTADIYSTAGYSFNITDCSPPPYKCEVCKETHSEKSPVTNICPGCHHRAMLWVAKRAYFEAQLAGEVVHGPRGVD